MVTVSRYTCMETSANSCNVLRFDGNTVVSANSVTVTILPSSVTFGSTVFSSFSQATSSTLLNEISLTLKNSAGVAKSLTTFGYTFMVKVQILEDDSPISNVAGIFSVPVLADDININSALFDNIRIISDAGEFRLRFTMNLSDIGGTVVTLDSAVFVLKPEIYVVLHPASSLRYPNGSSVVFCNATIQLISGDSSILSFSTIDVQSTLRRSIIRLDGFNHQRWCGRCNSNAASSFGYSQVQFCYLTGGWRLPTEI